MHRLSEVWRPGGDGPPGSKTINESGGITGGEAGIRTLDTAFRPYNGLANRRLRPLGHLTATSSIRDTDIYTKALEIDSRADQDALPHWRRIVDLGQEKIGYVRTRNPWESAERETFAR